MDQNSAKMSIFLMCVQLGLKKFLRVQTWLMMHAQKQSSTATTYALLWSKSVWKVQKLPINHQICSQKKLWLVTVWCSSSYLFPNNLPCKALDQNMGNFGFRSTWATRVLNSHLPVPRMLVHTEPWTKYCIQPYFWSFPRPSLPPPPR